MASEIETEWNELTENYKKLESVHQDYLRQLKTLTATENVCFNHINYQRRRIKVISDLMKTTISTENLRKINDDVIKREAQLQNIEETLPRKGGRFLRLILGNIDVSFLSQEAKYKYKDEYEKFKLICHVIAFIIIVLNLIFNWRFLEVLYLFFVVFTYYTIITRECVLRANGSKIKSWWRVHHVLTVVATGILLVWPENGAWQEFRKPFFLYNLYNCLVQYLQFKYQSGAIYRLKALGKQDNMTITIEGFHFWMWRGLAFLFPFLFIAYFYQLYNAYYLYKLYINHPESTWHVLASAVLMFVFFCGNSTTTLMVIPNKIKNRMLINYRLMTRRLLDVVGENMPLGKNEKKSK